MQMSEDKQKKRNERKNERMKRRKRNERHAEGEEHKKKERRKEGRKERTKRDRREKRAAVGGGKLHAAVCKNRDPKPQRSFQKSERPRPRNANRRRYSVGSPRV